jgi:hypothetical protein
MMPKGKKRFIDRITRPNLHRPLLISSNFDSLHPAAAFSRLLTAGRSASNVHPSAYRIAEFFLMKILLTTISLSCALFLGACSRSEEAASVKATPTPNQNLQKDAERLQQATARIAKEREKAAAHASPSASPSP